MKLFRKEICPSGRRHIYFCGIKIASYKKHPIPQEFGNNTVKIPQGNKNISVHINGEKNCIILDKDFPLDTVLKIYVFGDNNKITLGKIYGNVEIRIGYTNVPTYNANFSCGNGKIHQALFLMIEDNTSITVGNDCSFSYCVEVRCTDDHTIFDKHHNIINRAKNIIIGDRVWIGKSATILKNTFIPNDSVVGYGSIVTKKFEQPNIVIAGNPARKVKENITWGKIHINEIDHANI